MNNNKATIMEKAEAKFVERERKANERSKATAEYISEAKARAIKTARLRGQRLAKEEADRAAGLLQVPKAKVERGPRHVKGKTLASRIVVRGRNRNT